MCCVLGDVQVLPILLGALSTLREVEKYSGRTLCSCAAGALRGVDVQIIKLGAMMQ